MAQSDSSDDTLLTLTADIVAAHVSNNSVAVNDLPNLIQNVHSALSGIAGSNAAAGFPPTIRWSRPTMPSSAASSPSRSGWAPSAAAPAAASKARKSRTANLIWPDDA